MAGAVRPPPGWATAPEKSGVFEFDVEGMIELADAAAGSSRRGRPARAGTRGGDGAAAVPQGTRHGGEGTA